LTASLERRNYIKLIESEEMIHNRFKNIRAININGGDGYFSIVFVAYDIDCKNEVILKFFDPQKISYKDRLNRFYREADLLKKLISEERIIGFIDGVNEHNVYVNKKGFEEEFEFPFRFLYYAMELADSDLYNVIYNNNLDALERIIYFKEMVRAISCLHNRGICHRDLKLDNFLLKGKNVLLADLGTAKDSRVRSDNIYHDAIGELGFKSPESIFCIGISDEYSIYSDIYMMGEILFEMFTLRRLVPEISYVYESFEEKKDEMQRLKYDIRLREYRKFADELSRKFEFPNIFSYNDIVPKDIYSELNSLYQKLTTINLFNRLIKIDSIQRIVQICIIKLKNENKYQTNLAEQRRRRATREFRKQRELNIQR